jgi:hypothetical protein
MRLWRHKAFSVGVIFAAFLMLSQAVGAYSIREVEAVLSQAKSLDEFLASPELIENFLNALQRYYGAQKFPRVSYDVIIRQIREVIAKEPKLKERFWRKLSSSDQNFSFQFHLSPVERPVELEEDAWLRKFREWQKELSKSAAPISDIPDDETRLAKIRQIFADTESRIEEIMHLQLNSKEQGEALALLKTDRSLRAASAYLTLRQLQTEIISDKMNSNDAGLILQTISNMRSNPESEGLLMPIPKRLMSMTASRIPSREKLDLNEKIFKPIEEGVLKEGGILSAVPVRPFVALFRGIVLGECVGGSEKALESTTPERWAVPALEGTIVHFLETDKAYGFVEYFPFSLDGARYAGVVFGSPLLRQNTISAGKSQQILWKYFDEAYKRKPSEWKGFVIGEDNDFNNAGVQEEILKSASFGLGETIGESTSIQQIDPLAEIIPTLLPREGHARQYGGRMITAVTAPQSRRLTSLKNLGSDTNNDPSVSRKLIAEGLKNPADAFQTERLLSIVEHQGLLRDKSIDTQIRKLMESPRFSDRVSASRLILKKNSGDKKAFDATMASIWSADVQESDMALKNLGIAEPKDKSELVRTMEQHPRVEVRRKLMKELSEFYDSSEKIVASIDRALDDSDGEIQVMAAMNIYRRFDRDDPPKSNPLFSKAVMTLLKNAEDVKSSGHVMALEEVTEGNRRIYFFYPDTIRILADTIKSDPSPTAQQKVLAWMDSRLTFRLPPELINRQKSIDKYFPDPLAAYAASLDSSDIVVRTSAAKGVLFFTMFNDTASKNFSDPIRKKALNIILDGLTYDDQSPQAFVTNTSIYALGELTNARSGSVFSRQIAEKLLDGLAQKKFPKSWVRERATDFIYREIPNDPRLGPLLIEVQMSDPNMKTKITSIGNYLRLQPQTLENVQYLKLLVEAVSVGGSVGHLAVACLRLLKNHMSRLYADTIVEMFPRISQSENQALIAEILVWSEPSYPEVYEKLYAHMSSGPINVQNEIARGLILKESPRASEAFMKLMEYVERVVAQNKIPVRDVSSLEDYNGFVAGVSGLERAAKYHAHIIPDDPQFHRRLARLASIPALNLFANLEVRADLIEFFKNRALATGQIDGKVLMAIKKLRDDKSTLLFQKTTVGQVARDACEAILRRVKESN